MTTDLINIGISILVRKTVTGCISVSPKDLANRCTDFELLFSEALFLVKFTNFTLLSQVKALIEVSEDTSASLTNIVQNRLEFEFFT